VSATPCQPHTGTLERRHVDVSLRSAYSQDDYQTASHMRKGKSHSPYADTSLPIYTFLHCDLSVQIRGSMLL